MNVDSKIYSKTLANRLKSVCNKVLGNEQLAYLQGRQMHDGQVVINRALELFRSKKLKGVIACVDFRSAFDTVKHSFIWKTLERFNVGPRLIGYMQTLYSDAQSSVLNKNH
jgi:hypothetical protein